MGEKNKYFFFFFQAEDGIRDYKVTGVQTCALPISLVEELLDPVQHHRAPATVSLEGLLLVQGLDVGIGAIRIGAAARHPLRHPRGGVTVEGVDAHAHPSELLRGPRREEGRALHRSE